MTYKAIFKRMGETTRTGWYATPEAAQQALMVGTRRIKGVGGFTPLGTVAGDVFEDGKCTAAPRNGGLVTIEQRD